MIKTLSSRLKAEPSFCWLVFMVSIFWGLLCSSVAWAELDSVTSISAPASQNNDVMHHLAAGFLEILSNDLDAAEDHLTVVLSEDPDNVWGNLNMGVVNHRKSHFDKARAYYVKALSLASPSAPILAARATDARFNNASVWDIARLNLGLLGPQDRGGLGSKGRGCDVGLKRGEAFSSKSGADGSFCSDQVIEVHFPFGLAIPEEEGLGVLKEFLSDARRVRFLEIKGYTDSVGGQRFNDLLARKRAEYVRNWFYNNGVSAELSVKSKGLCCYRDPSNTKAAGRVNRRVEVHF